MWLVDYYHQVEPIFFVASLVVALGLFLMALSLVVVNILYLPPVWIPTCLMVVGLPMPSERCFLLGLYDVITTEFF